MQNPESRTNLNTPVSEGSQVHQIGTGANLRAIRIVAGDTVVPGQVLHYATLQFNDTVAPVARQMELLNIQKLGPYNNVANSCPNITSIEHSLIRAGYGACSMVCDARDAGAVSHLFALSTKDDGSPFVTGRSAHSPQQRGIAALDS